MVDMIAHSLQGRYIIAENLIDITICEDTAHAASTDAQHDTVVQILPDALIELPVAQVSMTEYHQRISEPVLLVPSYILISLRFADIHCSVIGSESLVESLHIDSRHRVILSQVVIRSKEVMNLTIGNILIGLCNKSTANAHHADYRTGNHQVSNAKVHNLFLWNQGVDEILGKRWMLSIPILIQINESHPVT